MIIENTYDKAADWIASNLSTELDLIELEYADGITLDDPEIVFGYHDLFGRLKYPVLCFIPDNPAQSPAANSSDMIDLPMGIVIVITENDKDRLTRKMLRYTDAIFSLIRKDCTLGESCVYSKITASDLFPGAPSSKDKAVISIDIVMTREER